MNNESILTKFAWGKAALLVFSLLMLANILILDIQVFTPRKLSEVTPEVEKPQTLPTPRPEESNLCPPACLEVISEKYPTPMVTPIIQAGAKELYIPLGSGSTKSTDWVELTGVEGVVDSANYPKIKSAIFEASLRIPTANGKAHAKLYNVTDKHDVWFSEVWVEGSTSQRVESANIRLDSGRKLYRVVMKSTMGYEAILDSARIKIILE